MAGSPHTRRITEARRASRDTVQGPGAIREGEQRAAQPDAIRATPRYKRDYDPEDEMSLDLIEPLGDIPKRPSKLKLGLQLYRLYRAAKKGWNMKGSWKTSAAGTAGVIGSVGVLLVNVAAYLKGGAVDWSQVGIATSALAASIGSLFARDNNVTSEEAGAK